MNQPTERYLSTVRAGLEAANKLQARITCVTIKHDPWCSKLVEDGLCNCSPTVGKVEALNSDGATK